jgi:SagB-type dehydrogenase family enzyme
MLSQTEIIQRMLELEECLPYDQYPVVPLPAERLSLALPLGEVLTRRASARNYGPYSLRLTELATILHFAYGITRSNEGTGFPRPFRAVPSGGALYPLEIYFHSASLEQERPGLYHYNPLRNELRLLREGDCSTAIARGLVSFQSQLAIDACAVLFLTAIFERSTFKYGARGYRFVLLEAGHVAQNINLVAAALGLGCVNIGGYYDRQIDEFLDLDSVTHSTVYMVALGKPGDDPRSAPIP